MGIILEKLEDANVFSIEKRKGGEFEFRGGESYDKYHSGEKKILTFEQMEQLIKELQLLVE